MCNEIKVLNVRSGVSFVTPFGILFEEIDSTNTEHVVSLYHVKLFTRCYKTVYFELNLRRQIVTPREVFPVFH